MIKKPPAQTTFIGLIYSITPVLSVVVLLNSVNLYDISSTSKCMQTTALIVEEKIEKDRLMNQD